MPILNVIDREGAEFTVDAPAGLSVMEAIRNSGRGDMVALCGGMKSCATCHVYIDESWQDALPPLDGDEDDLLDVADARRPNSRLSCQIEMEPGLDGLRVTIAPEE